MLDHKMVVSQISITLMRNFTYMFFVVGALKDQSLLESVCLLYEVLEHGFARKNLIIMAAANTCG